MSASLSSNLSSASQSSADEAATVLYVEDNPSNLQLVKLVLDSLRPSWRLLAAQDGHDGLSQAHAQCPDLILLNLQLSGMGGDALLAALRQHPPTARTPVLILSADGSDPIRDRLLGLGANDFLPKPFNVHVLVAKLDALWQTGRDAPGPVLPLSPQ